MFQNQFSNDVQTFSISNNTMKKKNIFHSSKFEDFKKKKKKKKKKKSVTKIKILKETRLLLTCLQLAFSRQYLQKRTMQQVSERSYLKSVHKLKLVLFCYTDIALMRLKKKNS